MTALSSAMWKLFMRGRLGENHSDFALSARRFMAHVLQHLASAIPLLKLALECLKKIRRGCNQVRVLLSATDDCGDTSRAVLRADDKSRPRPVVQWCRQFR